MGTWDSLSWKIWRLRMRYACIGAQAECMHAVICQLRLPCVYAWCSPYWSYSSNHRASAKASAGFIHASQHQGSVDVPVRCTGLLGASTTLHQGESCALRSSQGHMLGSDALQNLRLSSTSSFGRAVCLKICGMEINHQLTSMRVPYGL